MPAEEWTATQEKQNMLGRLLNEVQILTAEIGLLENRSELKQKETDLRMTFVGWLIDQVTAADRSRKAYSSYMIAVHELEQAENRLRDLEIAKLKGRRAASEAMISELQKALNRDEEPRIISPGAER